ncbi:MAG: glutamate 5-kinase [Phycisphaerales bacterium]|nr:glutamate 5-kinase [Phycisphaerales bacterium]
MSERTCIRDTRRVVVKIGSRTLVDDEHTLDIPRVHDLVDQMAALRHRGLEVICVSSGAVAAGLRELGTTTRPTDLPGVQAAAAIGQAALIGIYRERFRAAGIAIGQVLLTHADLRAHERHLNARNTFFRLLAAGTVPIVNENDTVAVDELRFGDNDRLSALVCALTGADGLIMLTTADGLMTSPDSNTLVPEVERVDDTIRAMAGGSDSDLGTGGMRSKVDAAAIVAQAGEWSIVANGHAPDVLRRLLDGEPLGTLFWPRAARLPGRKRWIAFFDHPRGDLVVDDGARDAIRTRGGSLLPIGVRQVRGDFERGEPVRIIDLAGTELGRGLVNHPADDIRRLLGCRSDEIVTILGRAEAVEVVHRDNLVLIDPAGPP